MIPVLPPLDPTVLAEHDAAHAELHDVVEALGPVRALFGFLQRRLLTEALANLQPTWAPPGDPLVFPAPRAFLSPTQHHRRVGAEAAFRYVDSRVAMVRRGLEPSVLTAQTPHVLHALTEGPQPSGKETNAGMIRRTRTSWRPEANAFAHPPAEACDELLEAALDLARRAPAPAVARGAWLTFTVLSIHPFVDGNGRVARLLYQAVASEGLPLGIDWGAMEQWGRERTGYVRALQAGQQAEAYDPDRLDAGPFLEYAAEQSIVGARIATARARILAERHDRLTAAGLPAPHALVLDAVTLWRGATLTELAGLGIAAGELTETVNELAGAGRLAWVPRPAARRGPHEPPGHHLVAPSV